MYYRKRNEGTIQKECLAYLQLLENQKKILHFDRLNSGCIFASYPGSKKRYRIRLCREGTSDVIVFLPDTRTIFLEFKQNGKPLTQDQISFRLKMESAGYIYFVITSVEELIKRLSKIIYQAGKK